MSGDGNEMNLASCTCLSLLSPLNTHSIYFSRTEDVYSDTKFYNYRIGIQKNWLRQVGSICLGQLNSTGASLCCLHFTPYHHFYICTQRVTHRVLTVYNNFHLFCISGYFCVGKAHTRAVVYINNKQSNIYANRICREPTIIMCFIYFFFLFTGHVLIVNFSIRPMQGL